MSARRLLDELHRLGIRVDYRDHDGDDQDGDHDDGDHHQGSGGRHLLLDSPRGVLTGELKTRIMDNKASLLQLLEEERRTREQAEEQGLVIRWAEEPGWMALRDPTTGEWHEWRAADCFPSMVREANRHLEKGEWCG